ncbi:ATP synthase subunit I [Anaerophilus nitritogenes]|uniref:ATP synthase subunit I n=1 Tax=Anaerophilus nitritogenes TaxID=2498136 RepID=UPI0013E9AB93|nr:ATP synthase subunit I [Anaerophilus nitritogenes]
MGHTWTLQKRIFKYTFYILITFILVSIIFLKTPKDMILGLIFGTAIGVLNFRLLSITLEKTASMGQRRMQVYATSQYLVRYIINGIVIFVGIRADYLNIIGVIIGLVLVKFVIVGSSILNHLLFSKNRFIRKEER